MAGAERERVKLCKEPKGLVTSQEATESPRRVLSRNHDSQHVFGGQLKAIQSTVNVKLHAPRGWGLVLILSPRNSQHSSPQEVPNK